MLLSILHEYSFLMFKWEFTVRPNRKPFTTSLLSSWCPLLHKALLKIISVFVYIYIIAVWFVWFNSEDIRVHLVQTYIDHTFSVLYMIHLWVILWKVWNVTLHAEYFKMFFLTTTFQCLLPYIYLQANETIFHYYSEIPCVSVSIIVFKYLSWR